MREIPLAAQCCLIALTHNSTVFTQITVFSSVDVSSTIASIPWISWCAIVYDHGHIWRYLQCSLIAHKWRHLANQDYDILAIRRWEASSHPLYFCCTFDIRSCGYHQIWYPGQVSMAMVSHMEAFGRPSCCGACGQKLGCLQLLPLFVRRPELLVSEFFLGCQDVWQTVQCTRQRFCSVCSQKLGCLKLPRLSTFCPFSLCPWYLSSAYLQANTKRN